MHNMIYYKKRIWEQDDEAVSEEVTNADEIIEDAEETINADERAEDSVGIEESTEEPIASDEDPKPTKKNKRG
ncbi:MAG: hypothetical protein Q4Q17_01150 [Tissierellia bacterium]|nr:hypothetical protein [Tissierellia bacterium]